MFRNFDINNLPLPPRVKEALASFKQAEEIGTADWGKHKAHTKELTGLSYGLFEMFEMYLATNDEVSLLRQISQIVTYAFLIGRRAGLAEAVFTAPVEENNEENPSI